MAQERDAQLDARIRAIAAPIVEGARLDLEEVEVRGQRGSRKVRLVVHAEEGLDIDVIARLSRRVGAALDEQDVVAGSYMLEVTSPGVDRPLRTARDFARNVGREVRVARRAEVVVDGPTESVGTLDAVDDEQIQLRVDGTEVTIPLRDVDHGKVVLPW
jgi:ribosome maturation factor RimP